MRIKYFEGFVDVYRTLKIFILKISQFTSPLANHILILEKFTIQLIFCLRHIFDNPQYFISLIISHPGSLLCSPTTSYHIFLTCYFSDLLTCTYNMYNGISITQLLLLLYCLQCIQTLQVWMNTPSVFFWSITDTSVKLWLFTDWPKECSINNFISCNFMPVELLTEFFMRM